MNSLDEIIDGLYLGNIFSPRNGRTLKEANIKYILSVTHDTISLPNDHEIIAHRRIEVEDYGDVDILEHFEEANKFIDTALLSGSSILVHCVQGASRSASFVAAYLMQKRGWSRDETLQFMRSKRPAVNPNQGFLEQLEVYQKSDCKVTAESPGYVDWVKRRDEAFAKQMQEMQDTKAT